MPEWRYFKDRAGNSYYFDTTGKIHITDKIPRKFYVVSADSIDYHIALAKELSSQGNYIPALGIYKSICALPESTTRIKQAQADAVKRIMAFKKNHGSRFLSLDRKSSLLIYYSESNLNIENTFMRYKIRIPKNSSLIRTAKRSGERYFYNGLSAGICINIPDGDKALDKTTAFDALISIDCEKYNGSSVSLRKAEELWRHRLGPQKISVRNEQESGNFRIYSFVAQTEKLKGFDLIAVNGPVIYFIRLITGEKGFARYENELRSILRNFSIIRFS